MGLFLNTSCLHNHYLDCPTLDVSETIERDCLSVLHKLHDQVNGLQLVQVVVQPLARLFNPASLAALVANVSSSPPSSGNNLPNVSSSISHSGNQSHATTPTSQHHTSSGIHLAHDLDGTSTTASISSTNLGMTSHNNHSRSQSFASAFNTSNNSNNSLLSSSSTYMMSPDTAQALIARLDTDRDVNWLMEIIGYGLSMPFSLTGEQDSVKDCCTIYCEWLASALLPYNERNEDSKYQQLSKLVPVPIRKDPNRYARKMLSHLYNVFLPRQTLSTSSNQKDQSDAVLTAVSRQAVLCHRVLRTIESIAQNQANLMDNQTWDHLLALLLSVNDKLLSAPTEPDDIGTQLHDRILGVLFELLLLASAKSLTTPSLWKTFHEMCLHWRHRPALVDHWRRITLQLTKRLVIMPSLLAKNQQETEPAEQIAVNPTQTACSSAIESAISVMDYKNLSQTWYRFLNLIGNPVELSDPNVISRTDEFYHSACSSDNVLDPRQHPCLNALPQIFISSMFGLRDFIDAFLGSYQQPNEEQSVNEAPTSYSQAKRGSTASLSNNSPTLTQPPTVSQQQSSHQPNPQPQALTPTQMRKSGIKSIAIKSGKVIPFTSSSSGSQSATLSLPVLDSGQTNDHSKSNAITNSSRQQTQFMQPRPSLTSLTSRASQNQQQLQFKLSVDRPKCNSILHIFGDWLFSAALIGSDLNHEVVLNNDASTSECDTSVGSSTTTEISDQRSYSPSTLSAKRPLNQKSTSSGQQSSSTRQQDSSGTSSHSEQITLDPPLTADSFEAGQAEAMGILCKIFSSKTSTEDISPSYLSRFYLCLQHCLSFGSGQETKYQQSSANQACGPIRRQLLASVLINSTSFLQKDLDGINLLIPCFIKAIEFVFECSEKEIPIQPPPRQHNRTGSIKYGTINIYNTTNHDLRRACILTLLNLLAYPFHFQDLAIRSCLLDSSPANTFKSLRPRLLKLLFVALQTENDPINMQILFGGLSLTIHDLASHADKQTNSKDEGSMGRIRNNSTSLASTCGDSTNNSLEASNRQDDTVSQNSFVFNSNGGFLVKSLHVTCHLLINIWKHDTQVSLAALELLTTIARLSTSSVVFESNEGSSGKFQKLSNNNNRFEMRNEYMQATKWICDYICNQCSRPPPAHSRDMHSTIVAAYQCLSVWFYNHPYLLSDESCVKNLMEVIELGVSGQKSETASINPNTGIANHSKIYKGDKIMKPSSMRVREAAESLLNICMMRATEPSGGFNNIVSSYDTILDELSMAELFGGLQHKTTIRQVQSTELRQLEAHRLFKYFSDENSVVFALLEGLNHDPSTKDSVLCLLRTAFGKHCWKIKFNYYTEKSREKIIANKTLGLIKRPFQQQSKTPDSCTRIFPFPAGHNKSIYFNNNAKFFPDTLENIPSNDLDHLVTTLDDYIEDKSRDVRSNSSIEKIGKIFSQQVLAEQTVMGECSLRIKRIDCEEPQPSTDLDASRILINHLGLKTALSSLNDDDKVFTSFINDLRSLDNHSVRTCDSVSIFYVRKNRTSPREILESVRSRQNVSLAFFEWILKLGQPTVVKDHNRWTGKMSSSWNNRQVWHQSDVQTSLTKNQMLTSDHGGAIFDGDRMTLYWSDMCQELAFLVPHRIEKVNIDTPQSREHCQTSGCDTNIIIFWLECPDDMSELPCDAMLSVAESGCLRESDDQPSNPSHKSRDYIKYFISPMKNGLYRINLATSFGRHWFALPLVDNMIVSRGILSGLIRESILNLCRRRRLDADSYQPPHVRRRLKIQEICNSHKISCRDGSTEFYNNLFKCKTT